VKACTMPIHISVITTLAAALLMMLPFTAMAQNSNPQDRIAERDLAEMKRLLPGIYTNEEQVYFQDNLDLPASARVPRGELQVRRTGEGFSTYMDYGDGNPIRARHDYRVENGEIQVIAVRYGRADCSRTVTREFEHFRMDGCDGPLVFSKDGIQITRGDKTFVMRRARTFKCWVSPRKTDGSYAFYNNLILHDQGGRIWIDATADHPRVGLKMRSVEWPTGVNRDSLVLYTYQGNDADYSPGYVWADPDAERLAINSRWIQASCTQGDETYTPNINLRTGSGN